MYDTIENATHAWVNEFNAIPHAVVEKLMRVGDDEVVEITPPGCGDLVYVYRGDYSCYEGEIERKTDEEFVYRVKLDDGRVANVEEDDFEVQRDYYLPMWGTLWSFGDRADDYWLEELGGLQKMSDCGFRVYQQDDFGYLFGIDGAGYDFYEEHWIPLYKARGLRWHKSQKEEMA